MKKILLLGLTAIIGTGAIAQQNNSSILLKGNTSRLKDIPTNDAKPMMKTHKSVPSSVNGKKTRATSRWYSYLNAIDTSKGGGGVVINNARGQRIWQDSTVQQVFTSGAGTVNYSSYYNVLDPQAPLFNDPNYYGGEMQIGPTNTYTVDTIVVWGSYFRPKGGNPDTLIISVVKGSATAANNDILYYNPTKTSFPEMITNGYVSGIGADTVMSMATFEADSVKRIAMNSNQSFVIKKVLTDADTSSFITPFTFKLPTPLAGEADRQVGVSVTFKSGGTWIPNVDTITNLNNFLGVFSEETNGAAQEYRGNSPDFDANMSGSMFSFAPDSYYPSFFIEGWNSLTVGTELAWVDYHLNCTSCGTVNVNDVNSNIDISAFPNPATSEVSFSLNLQESAKNVTIQLTNTLGQVLKQIDLGAVSANNTEKATINVNSLPKGLYIYTINADGQKLSNKLLVK